jgi:hypothetical protein
VGSAASAWTVRIFSPSKENGKKCQKRERERENGKMLLSGGGEKRQQADLMVVATFVFLFQKRDVSCAGPRWKDRGHMRPKNLEFLFGAEAASPSLVSWWWALLIFRKVSLGLVRCPSNGWERSLFIRASGDKDAEAYGEPAAANVAHALDG